MRRMSVISFAISASIILSGCSVIEKITGKQSPTTVSGAQATPVEKKEEPSKEIDRQSPVVTTDRHVIVPPIKNPNPPTTENSDYTPPTKKSESQKTMIPESNLGKIIGGSWTIIQVGNTIIDRDEDMPYIVFVPGDGSFYANNGCNTLNGSYSIEGDNITFHNVLTTLRYCADVSFDHEINALIADQVSTTLKIEEIGSETIISFVSPKGKALMKLRRGNLEFLNGQWDITAVAGLEELNTPATIFFDLTDMKLHGNTGCNFINGELYLDHRIPNAIDFSQIITTLRACQYPRQQTAILVALEETACAISDGSDKTLLLDSAGNILLELKKAPVAQQ